MNKLVVVGISVSCLALNACTGMSRGEQAGTAAGAGAVLGGLIGALAGGKNAGKWAAIGAASGATLAGLVTYALASDPFTQSAAQQAETWKQDMGAEVKPVKVSQVQENGQDKQQIDVQKILIPENQMADNQDLTKKARARLTDAVNKANSVGGQVVVLCPATAPPSVMSSMKEIGVSVTQDPTLQGGYALLLARNSASLRDLRV